jgi:hypothetical protein
VVQSRVESCVCVDLLHNLASELAGCGHQPLAQFVEMAAFQNVWIRPEPLLPTETYAIRQVLGLSTKQEPAELLRSDSFRGPARIVWQIRARKRVGRPSAESARSATVSSEGR